MSDVNAGIVRGYLTLDASDWNAELEKAGVKADELAAHDPNIKINVEGAAEALAKMEAVARAEHAMIDADVRLEKAENTLATVRRTTRGDSDQLINAEKAVEKARRDSDLATLHLANTMQRATADLKKFSDEQEQGSQKSAKSTFQMRFLADSIIALGPALVPISAAAAGLAGGLGLMGAAGILALVGIKREMEAGTAVGATYGRNLGILNDDLSSLGRTAAGNLLGSFERDVARVQGEMPFLTQEVGLFANILGKTSTNLLDGVISGLHTLEPLFLTAGVYIERLSAQFAAAGSSSGLRAFTDYALSVFPQVMATVESLVEAAVRLVAAFAPMGGGVLTLIKGLADAINALPIGALSALATVASDVYLAFRVWSGINSVVDNIAAGLVRLGVIEEVTAASTRALSIAGGAVGLALAGLAFIFQQQAESTRQAQQDTDDYAQALRASNGVIDESITAMAAKKLQDQGALDAARALGLSLNDVTQDALGNADAHARVAAQLKAVNDGFTAATQGGDDVGAAYAGIGPNIKIVNDALGMNNTALQKAVQQNNNMTAATGGTAAALDRASGSYSKAGKAAQDLVTAQTNLDAQLGPQAAMYGTTSTALDRYYQAQQKSGQQTEDTALKMFMENNAASILKGSLDALNGKSLSAADAQNAFDSSLVNMAAHTNAAGGSVKFASDSISGMTSASVALRGQLNGQIHNLEGVAEANGGLANSTGKAREQLVSMRQQIIDNAVAHGVDRKAVTEYVDSLFKIPKEVPPTKLDVDKAAADKKIADAEAALARIGATRPVSVIDANKQPLVDRAGEARARLLELQAQRTEPVVTANTGAALDRVGEARARLLDLHAQRTDPRVTADTGSALASIGSAKQRLLDLNATRADPVVSVQDNASARISSIIGLLSQVTDRTSTVTTNYVGVYSNKPAPDPTAPSANGNIFKAFAAGGLENHVAQIAPAGANRLWAEPETPGPAYIPLTANPHGGTL